MHEAVRVAKQASMKLMPSAETYRQNLGARDRKELHGINESGQGSRSDVPERVGQ